MTPILDRSAAVAQTRPIRDIGGPALRNVVDRGVRLLERCTQPAPAGDHNLGIMMPFLHLLEMLDSAEVLLDQSCVVGSTPCLRSGFEALCAIKWVLADVGTRALTYVAGDLKERVKWFEQMDPDTAAGRRFRSALGESQGELSALFPDRQVARSQAERLRQTLNREDYRAISEEYDRLASRRRVSFLTSMTQAFSRA